VSGIEPNASWQYSTNSGSSWTNGSGTTFNLPAGTYAIGVVRVRQIDVAGNTGTAGSNAAAINVDTTLPAAPTLALANDTGSSNADGITNVGTVNVSGIEPNASWQYSTNSGSSWTNGSGSSFALAAGTYAIGVVRVRQTDVAGNTGTAGSNAAAINVDTTLPAAPSLALANDTGSSNADGITNVGTVNVSGIEPNASWQYSTNSGSSWTNGSGTTFNLPAGTYAIGVVQVRQTDAAGNTGTAGSNSAAINVDTTLPAAPALALGTGVAAGATATEATQASGVVTVSGEPNASIVVTFTRGANSVTKTVIGNGAAQAIVLLAADLTTLGNGTVSVSAIATDVAGNVGAAGSTSFTLDSVAPTILNFTSTVADGTYLTAATIPLIATLSEQVRAGGSIAVTLNTGAVVILTAATQGNVLTGDYTVSPGEMTGDLDVISYSIVSTINDLAGNPLTSTALPTIPGQLASLKQIVVNAAISATAAGFSTDATRIPDARRAVRVIPITFTTPVRGVSLSAFRLFYNGRSVSLAGARITGSGATYMLSLPLRATNLKGIYSLRILPTARIVATANNVRMTQTPQIYWGFGRSVGMAPTTRALAFARP
jgi:hypothetical protein